MTTNKDISKAIENLTGYVGVRVSKGGGLCRFYVEDGGDIEQGIDLSLLDSEYVPLLNIYTAQEWAEMFAFSVKACKISPVDNQSIVVL